MALPMHLAADAPPVILEPASERPRLTLPRVGEQKGLVCFPAGSRILRSCRERLYRDIF